MIVNGKEYDLKTMVENLDMKSHSYVQIGSLMLTKEEVAILDKNMVDYHTANSLRDLMIKIEDVLDDESMDPDDAMDLDYVLESIGERDYYENTKK